MDFDWTSGRGRRFHFSARAFDRSREVFFRAGRGDFGTPGTNSPFRDRSVEENLDLFRRMRAGEFEAITNR